MTFVVFSMLLYGLLVIIAEVGQWVWALSQAPNIVLTNGNTFFRVKPFVSQRSTSKRRIKIKNAEFEVE